MEILGPCPEAAVFHSACVLAEQVRHTVAASLLCYASLFFLFLKNFHCHYTEYSRHTDRLGIEVLGCGVEELP